MPKIAEMIDKETLAKLLPGAQDALLKVMTQSQEKGRPELSWGLPVPNIVDAAEISEAMVRYVHGRMVSESRSQIGHYQHQWSGHIADVVRDMGGGTLGDTQASRLAQHIGWQIRGNGIGRNVSRYIWELTDLDASRKLGMFNQKNRTIAPRRDRKLDEQVYVQTKRNPEKPVATSFDLALIPPPEPTPDGVVEYVEKLTKGYSALQQRYVNTSGALARMTSERDELLEAAKALAADEWKIASTRIAALVAKAGGGDEG